MAAAQPQAAQPAQREHLLRQGPSFAAVHAAQHQAAPAGAVAQEGAAEYPALAQSLRETALLEATLQTVAESGQRVLQRPTKAAPQGLP